VKVSKLSRMVIVWVEVAVCRICMNGREVRSTSRSFDKFFTAMKRIQWVKYPD
jgi:hypothetical protein